MNAVMGTAYRESFFRELRKVKGGKASSGMRIIPERPR